MPKATEQSKKVTQVIDSFIDFTQQHPVIYDFQHPKHKDVYVVKQAWLQILSDMQSVFSPQELGYAKMDSYEGLKNKYYGLR